MRAHSRRMAGCTCILFYTNTSEIMLLLCAFFRDGACLRALVRDSSSGIVTSTGLGFPSSRAFPRRLIINLDNSSSFNPRALTISLSFCVSVSALSNLSVSETPIMSRFLALSLWHLQFPDSVAGSLLHPSAYRRLHVTAGSRPLLHVIPVSDLLLRVLYLPVYCIHVNPFGCPPV